jgi:hypothetical protein
MRAASVGKTFSNQRVDFLFTGSKRQGTSSPLKPALCKVVIRLAFRQWMQVADQAFQPFLDDVRVDLRR